MIFAIRVFLLYKTFYLRLAKIIFWNLQYKSCNSLQENCYAIFWKKYGGCVKLWILITLLHPFMPRSFLWKPSEIKWLSINGKLLFMESFNFAVAIFNQLCSASFFVNIDWKKMTEHKWETNSILLSLNCRNSYRAIWV